jgi:hypothetical protein
MKSEPYVPVVILCVCTGAEAISICVRRGRSGIKGEQEQPPQSGLKASPFIWENDDLFGGRIPTSVAEYGPAREPFVGR